MATKEYGCLPSVEEVIKASDSPHLPTYCIRPNTIISTTEKFVSTFKPGDVLYAAKCNMEPEVLKAIWKGGVRHFDCASLKECEILRNLFGSTAGIHLLHPIKAPEDIREAYTKYNVKTFAIDSIEELNKIFGIVREDDPEVAILIRLGLPSHSSQKNTEDEYGEILYSLTGKFGVEGVTAAAKLLQLARPRTKQLGVSFHVGSQCIDPNVYTQALQHVRDILVAADIPIEVVDIGGGFPIPYVRNEAIPSLEKYMETIRTEFEKLPKALIQNARLWCEPGRALVGAGCSLVIRVEDRRLKGNCWVLYVNDGIYGHFQDALPFDAWPFPVRLIRESTASMCNFALFGPTYDNMDYMPGPFSLPSDVKPGDHIEVGQLGAYSTCFRMSFNGFDRVVVVLVRDDPML